MSDFARISDGALKNAELVKEKMASDGVFMDLTRGPSMEPMLSQHRDVVVIEPVTRELKKYDVPLYVVRGKDDLVLHRILEVRENDYVIRGDNTYSFEYIPKEHVIGVLKEFYRKGRYINCTTNKKYHFYVRFTVFTYPLRRFWKCKIKPILRKIKRKIVK